MDFEIDKEALEQAKREESAFENIMLRSSLEIANNKVSKLNRQTEKDQRLLQIDSSIICALKKGGSVLRVLFSQRERGFLKEVMEHVESFGFSCETEPFPPDYEAQDRIFPARGLLLIIRFYP